MLKIVFGMAGLLLLVCATSVDAQDGVLIVAPADFMEAARPLAKFKQASARPAYLVSLDTVDATFTGVDQPERVKRCILHYRNNFSVRHVILVGDVDRFPGRYTWWRIVFSPTNIQENYAVTDLYYADLVNAAGQFETWDSNGNGRCAETLFQPEGTINQDNINYLPDVSVGRIPASTAEEVTRYVHKVIRYETAVTPGESWFKRAALYTGSWLQDQTGSTPVANNTKDAVGTSLTNQGFTLTKRYWDVPNQQPPANMPQAAIDDFNSGMGFVNYFGHGNPGAWACISVNHSWPQGPNDLLRGLSNDGKWPVVFAAACDTGGLAYLLPYGPYIDVNGVEHAGTNNGEVIASPPPVPAPIQEDNADHGVWFNNRFYAFDTGCLGETFLFDYGNPAGSGGAIAYLGLRTGGQVTIQDLDRFFFQAYDTGGHSVLGDMWRHMIEEYHTFHNIASSNTWSMPPANWSVGHRFTEPLKLIVFGDPSVVVGGAFTRNILGMNYDGLGGPLQSYNRYRCVWNMYAPGDTKLTAQASSSVVFDPGIKITGFGAGPNYGFHANGTASNPVGLLTPVTSAATPVGTRGIVLYAQLRLVNGGSIKF